MIQISRFDITVWHHAATAPFVQRLIASRRRVSDDGDLVHNGWGMTDNTCGQEATEKGVSLDTDVDAPTVTLRER